ncbi:LuxR C-terminal-related transcriptional regulator [Agromyces sp. NPDC049794]|uniref:ATP-binding protein n=1 Tax=unclassified Agromyces TaxID=2639701 RepID=UPI0034000E83
MSGQRLTPRESAVLAAVGRRLNNPEIAAELFISVRTVESHIASLKRKLGAETRADLIAAAGVQRQRAASVRLPRTAFVGRDAELAAIADQLETHRWVTVVGPGGVGKTRLALEFASRGERMPLVVELEHAEPGDVVARIARALDLEAGPGADAATRVALALAAHPYLLVLDNVDRVGRAVGEMVARAQQVAPDLRVLTTSRTPIGDAVESVFPLVPLATDGPDAAAVAMFLDRLGAVGRAAAAPMALSTAQPSPADREVAERVCRRLDGLPLALELAAAVARHLSLEELASRLDRDFATLDRAAPEGRHRTLETAFDWTWDLLTDEEREVLCRLAALPRTFDVDLAVAVTHPGAEGVLVRLLDHSMVVPTGGRPRRFRLLAVMREFVRARTDPAVIREVLQRHAEYLEAVVTEFVRHARTDDSAEAVHTSETLCPEVNAAVRWALAAGHPAAVTLAASLAIGVEQYGSDVDSVRTLAMAANDERVRAGASAQQLLDLGIGLSFVDVHLVDELSRQALARADDPPSRLAANHLAGLADAYSDRVADALAHLDEAERLAIELDEPWQLAAVRQMRGVAYCHTSPPDLARAVVEFEAAMRGYSLVGDAMHANNARFMMAFSAAEDGLASDQAAEWAAECADYAVRTGNVHELAHAHLVQSMLRADAADPDGSDDGRNSSELADLSELTGTFRRLGDLRCVTRSLMLRARLGGLADRVPLLAEAADVAHAAGDPAHETTALGRLAAAHWERGDRIATLTALDRLGAVAGADAAAAATPQELAEERVAG